MDPNAWAGIVTDALNWEQAHLNVENAAAGLAPEQRGQRAPAIERSVWEILEHIRIAQHDLLRFCTDPAYHHDLEWPAEYWPPDPAPGDEEIWSGTLEAIRRDREALVAYAVAHAETLTEKIPAGTGQTYLRTVLVAMDHTAYHTAQLVAVRRLIGAWPPEVGTA
jgi:uncharacterized damage-inducible protein DinB